MLSRVADSIYWMSRYVERAENVSRFIDVNLQLALDVGPETGQHWSPLIYTTGEQENYLKRYRGFSQADVIYFLALDPKNPNSILSCLWTARENARAVRDMVSSQMWEELNKFYLMVRMADRNDVLADPFDFFTRIKFSGYTLDGATQATMSQGEAWHFHRLGQMIERADKTSRILDVKYYLLLPQVDDIGSQIDTNQWAALLRSASAFEMYRKEQGRITPAQVAEFLVCDRQFPRSMHFCISRAEESLLAITGGSHGLFTNPAEQVLGRLKSQLDFINIDDVIKGGLHQFIDAFQLQLNEVGQTIFDEFFAAEVVAPPAATAGKR